ncbi:MAG: ribosome small subunit-dependent GTPase A [Bacteroidia bacterium]|jgi:ribosome biogenesis GTPase
MKGRVIRSTGSFATVRTLAGETLECTIRGIFRLKGIRSTNPVAVGDWVEVSGDVGESAITEIYPRENYIIRKSINLSKESHILAANIDQAFVIATLHSPRTSLGFIDRLLVTCEAYHIPVSIVLNKTDLYTSEKDKKNVAYFYDVYRAAGYRIMETSVENRIGIDALSEAMRGKVNLFSGHSGAGKTSLINLLAPGVNLRTGALSSAHNKGQHTTTFAELHELFSDTWIIDTPGIKEFGMVDMEKYELDGYFPEIAALSEACKFNNCLHVAEPGCAVRDNAATEKLHARRYESYLGMLESDELKKIWKD